MSEESKHRRPKRFRRKTGERTDPVKGLARDCFSLVFEISIIQIDDLHGVDSASLIVTTQF